MCLVIVTAHDYDHTVIMRAVSLLFTLGFFCSMSPSLGQGSRLAQHLGANNPILEGFSSQAFGTPMTEGVTNDLGVNAWSTLFDASGIMYQRKLPDFSSLDWVLSITLRIVTPGVEPRTGKFQVEIVTGGTYFDMWLGSDANGNPMVQATSHTNQTPIITLSGAGSTYNEFQLAYNQAAHTADLWVNGTVEFSGLQARSYPSSPMLWWGGGYQGAAAYQANWNLVSVQIVPEPSISLLLTWGSLFLAARLHRSRHPTSSASGWTR